MNIRHLASALLLGLFASLPMAAEKPTVTAYVAYMDTAAIDPSLMTRINYAYMGVNDSLDGVTLMEPHRLRSLVALKEQNPGLEVLAMLGPPAINMSRAFRSDSLRALVVADCIRVMDEYGLDGIDVDWEWPGRGDHALPLEQEVDSYVKFLTELRSAMPEGCLLTMAVASSGYSIDFDRMTPLVDCFNVMNYDLGTPPDSHHTALYPSERSGWMSGHRSVEIFTAAGVPRRKIVYGLAFYGLGCEPYPRFVDFKDFTLKDGCSLEHDSVAHTSYVADSTGRMVLSIDTPESIAGKCRYIREQGLGGAMYWRAGCDDSTHTLARTVAEGLKGNF
ncbi:MAG: glycosyl hydrolase family 18 protein [Muribaculaceae bacterium]|nr:glycosyl hydrolase family 18 protein [Muribaculaceae bacterium]